jgi:hypothetical protein
MYMCMYMYKLHVQTTFILTPLILHRSKIYRVYQKHNTYDSHITSPLKAKIQAVRYHIMIAMDPGFHLTPSVPQSMYLLFVISLFHKKELSMMTTRNVFRVPNVSFHLTSAIGSDGLSYKKK